MGSEKGEKGVLVYSFKERAWLDRKKRIEARERDEFESSFVLFLCTRVLSTFTRTGGRANEI